MTGQQRTSTGEQLIREAAKLDPDFGKRLKAYLDTRSYGLIFEHNRSEHMTVTGKPIKVGDMVITHDGDEPLHVLRLADGRVTLDDGTEHAERDLTPVVDFNQPVYCGLEETGRVTNAPDTHPSQIVIEGENYHALQALTFAYKGKIDCIYLDPPYNTGARDWRYDNDYVDATDGYRHSKWLAFMERRLNLAKNLLNPEDSVLICTIDEKEVNRLGLLLEQVFPTARIQMVSSVINPTGVARRGEFYRTDEYIFFVEIGDAHPALLPLNAEWSISGDADLRPKPYWRLLRRSGSGDRRQDSPGCFYPIFIDDERGRIAGIGDLLPEGKPMSAAKTPASLRAVWPIRPDGTEGCWQLSPASIRPLLEQGFVKLGGEGKRGTVLYYLAEGERRKIDEGILKVTGRNPDGSAQVEAGTERKSFIPGSQWRIPSHSARHYGSKLLTTMFGGEKRFSFPKSLYAVEDCIRFFVADKPNAIILDFFAGSGTTTHAVMRLNHADGGHRMSISVTNNEVGPKSEKELAAKGLKPGDPEWDRLGICRNVTIPRVTAAITGRTPQGNPIKGRYRFNDEFDMSDGFRENAVFYKLVYLDPEDVRMDCAFDDVAPLLWLRAGATGPIIAHESENGFEVNDHYGILFDFSAVNAFAKAVNEHPNLSTLYAVTEDTERKRIIEDKIPGAPKPIYLYEEYFRDFKLNEEGALQ